MYKFLYISMWYNVVSSETNQIKNGGNIMRTGTHNELTQIFGVRYEGKSLTKQDDLYSIISGPAYRDMTPRHLKGIGKKPEDKKEIFNWLAWEFKKYFNDKPKDENGFDKWHYEICEEVRSRIEAICTVGVHFGKAQKLINMSFKNFYCFSDYENFTDHFKYCHMPLDSYTLSWFTNAVDYKKALDSWSNMNYPDYFEIQNTIRNYFKSKHNETYHDSDGNVLSPFIAEFYIWAEPNYIKANNKWLETFKPILEYPSFVDGELFDKISEIHGVTEKLLKRKR